MTRFVFILCMFAVAFLAGAEEKSYMTFESISGAKHSVASENLTISFNGGMLNADNGAENISIKLSELRAFYFGTESGIKDILEDESSPLNVYRLDGTFMGVFTSISQIKSELAAGTYVIKSNKSTIKIIL